MDVVLLIIVNIILPLFFLIGTGSFLHRKFNFEMNTLSKLNTYLLLPAVGFHNIYESDITGKVLVEIVLFLSFLNVALILLGNIVAKAAGFNKGLSATFKNSIVLSNSGNFGIPVSQLVFQHNPLGLSIQVIVMIFQNLLTFTYGLFNSVSANYNGTKMLSEFFKLPILYALVLGLLFNIFQVRLPHFLSDSIYNLSNAFFAIALITLGAQVAYLKIKRPSFALFSSMLGRLIVSPIIAFFIIQLFGIEGITAQALFIASSCPTSRNSALLALEYNNYPEYAAEAVLMSTMLSSLTVTIVVFLSKILF